MIGWIRDAWLIMGVTLVLLLFIELLSSIRFRIPGYDSRTAADTYHNADWTTKYFKEGKASFVVEWAPYAYWRCQPFRGQYINVDAKGIRKTWQPESMPGEDGRRPRIFFFGGSTTWGTGARDDFTIPSITARLLWRKGISAHVTNFGQIGYVSTQELIALLLELQKGNVPDVVVFYDGVNDTFSAFQQRIAGLPQNEYNRVREFNSSRKTISIFADNLSSIRFLGSLIYRRSVRHPAVTPIPFRAPIGQTSPPTDSESVTKGVVDDYERNIEAVRALARRYGFRALFYWQPSIFGKAHLTQYEERELRKNSAMKPFFDLTYRLVKQHNLNQGGETGFHDLSEVFSDTTEPLFVDWCHMGETGNSLVAEQIAGNIE